MPTSKRPTPTDGRPSTHGRSGRRFGGASSAVCLVGGSAGGSARTRRWRCHRAVTPSYSSSGEQSAGGTERLAQEVLDAVKIAVRIQVTRFDVVRAGDDPQLLRLFGRLEERVRVADRHDLVQRAVGE